MRERYAKREFLDYPRPQYKWDVKKQPSKNNSLLTWQIYGKDEHPIWFYQMAAKPLI
jgi:hypothetical protein